MGKAELIQASGCTLRDLRSTWVRGISLLEAFSSQVWLPPHTVVPATVVEAEAGELLESNSSEPAGVAQWAVCLPMIREVNPELESQPPLDKVAPAYNPSSWEAQIGRSGVQGQPGLVSWKPA